MKFIIALLLSQLAVGFLHAENSWQGSNVAEAENSEAVRAQIQAVQAQMREGEPLHRSQINRALPDLSNEQNRPNFNEIVQKREELRQAFQARQAEREDLQRNMTLAHIERRESRNEIPNNRAPIQGSDDGDTDVVSMDVFRSEARAPLIEEEVEILALRKALSIAEENLLSSLKESKPEERLQAMRDFRNENQQVYETIQLLRRNTKVVEARKERRLYRLPNPITPSIVQERSERLQEHIQEVNARINNADVDSASESRINLN